MSFNSYQEKLRLFQAYAQDKKIPKGFVTVPKVMFLSMGEEMPPIILCKTWQIALSLGSNFAVGWGLAMHFVSWRRHHMPVTLQFFAALLSGVLFGFSMAFYYKSQRKKYGLTTWEEFKG